MSSNENETMPKKVSKSKFVVSKHVSKLKNASTSSASSDTALARRRLSIDSTCSSKMNIMSSKELPAIATLSARDTQDPKGFLEKRGYQVTKELGSGGFAT